MPNANGKTEPLFVTGDKPPRAKSSPYVADSVNNTNDSFSLIQANAEDIRLLVASVLAAGDAVMFSCARKGAAYAVTVYHDGVPAKQWAAELEVFEQIVDFFTKIALQQIPQEIAKRLTLPQ